MKGLPLLLPVLSCVFALATYLLDGSVWSILAAFFIAGPAVILLIGLILSRQPDDADDIEQNTDRKE